MRVQGKKIAFVREKRRLPNGVVTRLDRIEHPGAALIIPALSRDRVILLRQYRAVIGKELLELPAGTVDKGEQPLCCARRELTEETGYAARTLKKLGKIYPVPGYSDEVIHIYVATGLFPRTAEQDADEMIRTVDLSRTRVRALFAKGRIVDAKTICALCFYGWL
jgi:ADP-ribose pyrophosphatase